MVDNNSQASAEKVEQPRHMEIRVDPEYDLSVLTAENAEFLASFSQEARKRAVRKVRLCSILSAAALTIEPRSIYDSFPFWRFCT